jgi:hypothetical protein
MHKNDVLRCPSPILQLSLLRICFLQLPRFISTITGAKMYGWLAVAHSHDSSLESTKDTLALHTEMS